jgi:hypothetical protein
MTAADSSDDAQRVLHHEPASTPPTTTALPDVHSSAAEQATPISPTPLAPAAAGLAAVSGVGPHHEAFAKDSQEYLRTFLQLADQKAAFVFTAAGAILALLYSKGAHLRWAVWPPPTGIDGVAGAAAFVAMIALVVAGVYAVAVVGPREAREGRGLFYWGEVRAHGPTYVDAVARLTADDALRERLENCRDLADVCDRKYRSLRRAIRSGAIGTAAALIYLLVFGEPAPSANRVEESRDQPPPNTRVEAPILAPLKVESVPSPATRAAPRP